MFAMVMALLASTPAPAALFAADTQWREGLLRQDKAALETIIAPEYTLTTAFGLTTRETWLQSAVVWVTKAIEWRGTPHVDLYGEAALVRGTLHWHVVKDKPDPRTGSAELDLDFFVTDVWMRRAGHWQVVSRHSTVPLER